MRKNKKNWEIFCKSGRGNAIVCDHFPTTPALIPTTNNRENTMMVETMTEGKNKYQVELLKNDNFNKKFFATINDVVYLMCDTSTVASINQFDNRVCKLENNGFTTCGFHYEAGKFILHFKRKV
jgi:hypothetical protein